jgi:uncharacterized membrane protein YgdD (TMEM256/DUF423 family)
MMNPTTATRIAAAFGFLAVALGAFGAHGLKATLEANGTSAIWEKAVLYHFIHAVMLFVLAQRPVVPRGPWWSFAVGVLIFSGSLYVLAVTNVKWLGRITPLGGISFLLGWSWLAWTGLRGDAALRN